MSIRPYYQSDRVTLYHGDSLEILPQLDECAVDSVVTDPPYGLSFMGKHWDYDVPGVGAWASCLRALKPGGHLLAFAGTRTQHRMAVNIEDAGFDVRDMIAWVYGSGFPKSHNLKDQWSGWGTALKPAMEPITVARKPLDGTVAANVLTHGTGAINVDGSRVAMSADDAAIIANMGGFGRAGFVRTPGEALNLNKHPMPCRDAEPHQLGRWPANLIHDGSQDVAQPLGSAARFFYCAKASKADREDDNMHPTVKPTDLMRYLCRLVTPPDGIVLDPFAGSGSTGKAAMLEGFRFIGIERDEQYCEIAAKRIQKAEAEVAERLVTA